ncbi:MAG: hypothetical protein Q9169_007257, partial [Polycauliona sp. 2 TL-2023]
LRVLQLERIILKNGTWEDIMEEIRHILDLDFCAFGRPLCYHPLSYYGSPFYAPVDYGKNWRDVEYLAFMEANGRYVLEGGEHPYSPHYVPDRELLEKISMWKEMRSAVANPKRK